MSIGRAEQFSTRGAFFVAGLCMSALAPMVPEIKSRLRLDDGALGLLLLCVGLGSLAFMPFAGGFAARFGCRRVIAVSILTMAASLPFFAWSSNVSELAIALLIFGASLGTLDVTMNIQAVIVEEASGRPMMSGFHGLFSVGGVCGAGGISLLMGFGVPSYLALILLAVVSFLILGACYAHLLPSGGDAEAPVFALPHGRVILLGVVCFVLFMAEGSVADWSGVFLTSIRKVEAAQAGLGYVAFATMMTVNRLLGDSIVKALGRRPVVFLGSLCGAVGFSLAILAPWWPLSLVGFGLVGAGLSNVVPVMFTAAGRQTAMPPNLAVAAVTTMGYAGILTGPPALGFIARSATLPVALAAIAVLLIGVAVTARATIGTEA